MQIQLKTAAELSRMRDAGRVAAEVLAETAARIRPGITTQELNDFAHGLTLRLGAESAPLNYRGFPRSICTSVNHVVCHGIPSPEQVLREGDIVNVDVTVRYRGFHGDTSRTYGVGAISEEARQLLAETERAMRLGIRAIRPGAAIADVGAAIDDHLTPRRYGIVRELSGHGIGRDFHEPPPVLHYRHPPNGVVLQPGMTFTVEPMVNRGSHRVVFSQEDGWTVTTADGSLSAQFEHTVAVTPDGWEVLTLLEGVRLPGD
jgi:methionyl aminopeptidase